MLTSISFVGHYTLLCLNESTAVLSIKDEKNALNGSAFRLKKEEKIRKSPSREGRQSELRLLNQDQSWIGVSSIQLHVFQGPESSTGSTTGMRGWE